MKQTRGVSQVICKQLNEIKAMISIDESQKIKSMESRKPFLPIISNVMIKPLAGAAGSYGIFFDAVGEPFVMGKQRGGPRGFSSVESAVKTCRTAGIRSFGVEISPIDMLRHAFSKEEDCEE